ncbi:MAG: L,D-transpeptidase family protein, partial [Lachnospiraceae bacterium]|nr:L,D-transpeptidase family protein [Lachnospiraceae bacterium]
MKRSRIVKGIIFIALFAVLLFSPARSFGTKAQAASRWTKLKDKYRNKKTNRLIFVKCKKGSSCRVVMYRKVKKKSGKYKWKKVTACDGYIGQNGLGKTVEGDRKTPKGTYKITKAFGIADDPGCPIPYIKLHEYLYWSGEAGSYNQMVDSRTLGHIPTNSEHLISISPQYTYALAINYNRKNIVGKGAAIFLHCTGSNPYTMGCVAIPEKNMKIIMQNVTKRTR